MYEKYTMKGLILMFFVNLGTLSFSQLTFNELQKVIHMDQSQFETYCLSNDYRLSKYVSDEYSSGTDFVKGYGKEERYLCLYDFFYTDGKTVTFQTQISTEYLGLKTQVENLDFEVIDTYVLDNGCRYTEYSNLIYKVTTIVGPHTKFKDIIVYSFHVSIF